MLNKTHWRIITIICYSLIFLSIVLVAGYYYIERIDRCTSDPYAYIIERFKERTTVDDVRITLSFVKGGFVLGKFNYLDGELVSVINQDDLLRKLNLTILP